MPVTSIMPGARRSLRCRRAASGKRTCVYSQIAWLLRCSKAHTARSSSQGFVGCIPYTPLFSTDHPWRASFERRSSIS